MKICFSLFLVLGLAIGLPVSGEEKKPPSGTITGKVSHRLARKRPTIIYIEKMAGKTFEPPKEPAVLDQRNLQFIPPALPILVGSSVKFTNSDKVKHNIYTEDGEKYNLGTFGPGQSRQHVFNKPGILYTQFCNVHAEMIGYILVLETPFFAVADRKGVFSIKGVPPGTWKLTVWNPKLTTKYDNLTIEVQVTAGKECKAIFKPKKKKKKKK